MDFKNYLCNNMIFSDFDDLKAVKQVRKDMIIHLVDKGT